jgi:hypothetical protein
MTESAWAKPKRSSREKIPSYSSQPCSASGARMAARSQPCRRRGDARRQRVFQKCHASTAYRAEAMP